MAWFDYTLDEMGNRTLLDSHLGQESYNIDQLNRLTSASYPGGYESYSYYFNGDRKDVNGSAYIYNANGQLDTANAPMLTNAYIFTYDENGNVATMTDGTGQSDGFTWDWANHMTSATIDGQTVNYSYDAMGVRTSATISGTTQNLLWDRAPGAPAELPLLVDDGSQSYIHGAGPLAQVDPTGTRYDLLGDGLGSVRTIIDSSGAAVGAADYTAFGEYRAQSGVTSRFGFTGEYYAQETGMWHLRARDLHPALGRFLSADPVQPCPEGSHPGTQGYNLYAYVANNPTTWVDPSGYSVASLFENDLELLSNIYAMGMGLGDILECAADEECKNMHALINDLGAQTYNALEWSAEGLYNVFFSTYPHQPTPVSPAALVFSLTVSNTPVVGDLYDLVTAVTGYDFITGQYLAGWERLVTLIGVIPIPGVSGGSLRHGMDAVDSFASHGDDLARIASRTCSFDEATPVTTDEGSVPIKDVDVGDKVLAWDEATDSTGYFTVTDAYTDVHEVLVYLTVDGETIETTPEHPFFTIDEGWTPAGELSVGDMLRTIDGMMGVVNAITFDATSRVMYNMTVADAHTYVVGDGEWLIHDCGGNSGARDFCTDTWNRWRWSNQKSCSPSSRTTG